MKPLLLSPWLQGLAHAAVGLLCAGLALSFAVVPAEALADQAIALLVALGAYHLLQAARVRVAERLEGLEEHVRRERQCGGGE